LAARKIREKARLIAAHLLEVSPDDLEWRDYAFRVKGAPDRFKTMQEIAFAAYTNFPQGLEGGLEAVCQGRHEPGRWRRHRARPAGRIGYNIAGDMGGIGTPLGTSMRLPALLSTPCALTKLVPPASPVSIARIRCLCVVDHCSVMGEVACRLGVMKGKF